MNVLNGDWLNVYYETEKDAAEDVFAYADAKTASDDWKLCLCRQVLKDKLNLPYKRVRRCLDTMQPLQ